MEAYRYQEFAYLVVPIMTGYEFFVAAKKERASRGDSPLGAYILDICGFIFMALIPALFIFTIACLEAGLFAFREETLARLDRYGVMFFFMGAWWQVYIIGALRARRSQGENLLKQVWIPFISLGIYISLLILWVSPWGLKWVSLGWFILFTLFMAIIKPSKRTVERVLWILAGITFFLENILFLWLETVV